MTELQYRKGDVLFREGDPCNFVWRILSGQVEVVKELADQIIVLETAEAGEYVGDAEAVRGRKRATTVRALSDVTAELIGRDDFCRLINEDKDFAYSVLAGLSDRLRQASQKVVELTTGQSVDRQPKLSLVTDNSDEPEPEPEAEPETVPDTELAPDLDLDLRLFSASKQMAKYIPKDGLVIDHFPFSVGRKPRSDESNPDLAIDLSIEDSKPYSLSRKHFSIVRAGGEVLIRDLGSYLGTQVDDEILGDKHERASLPLKAGECTLIAGGKDSPYAFRLVLERY